MAEKVVGIEVQIGGDTSGLSSALSKTNKEINATQRELSQVERLLKLDPSNTELLAQKQQLLSKAVNETSTKVEALKQAKANADKQMQNGTNINQEEYRKLQREIVSSETSMKKLQDEAKNTNNAISKIGEAFSSIGSKASDVLSIVTTGATAITSAGVAGAVAMGKASIDSYAEYEQLVGGVETLFGSNYKTVEEYAKGLGVSMEFATSTFEQYQKRSETVLQNANNAYQTAGISANEYMETVTSFSASLNASLGEYAWQSANYADVAIRDMSDNANKMGTSMESIQTAYQGFAKGNFTLLDNLKLGYGGTKTEMERLLRDAEKIEGYELGSLDMNNFADVIDAIHIVQTQMGITGTTAKEASQTIAGSLTAMKSSWANLLTGMTDDNADIEALLEMLVESVLVALENIIPRIEIFVEKIPVLMTNILNKIIEYLPQFLESGGNILQSLVTGIQQNIPQIMNIIMQVIMMLITSIISMLPQILQMGITILVELINGIAQQMPTLIPTIVECVLLIVQTLLDNIDSIIQAGINILTALIQGILNSLPLIIEKLPEIITTIITVITDNLPLIIEAGIMLLGMLTVGILQALPELIASLPQIITAIVDGLVNGITKISEVGKNIVEGLWNGILLAKDWLFDKVWDFAMGILDTIMSALGIESPSKVFRDQVGKNIALGVGVGFENSMKQVAADMSNVMEELTGTIQGRINIGNIPNVSPKVTSENNYITKNYSNTTEVVRQPTMVVLEIDKKELGRIVVPAYDTEKVRLGVSLA